CSLTAENGERTLMPVVRVDGREFSAEQILIATGSAPARLPIPGADLTLTSDDLLKLSDLPKSIAIIGGGVIGMEFASILQAFGVDVTVIEYCKEILPPFDKEVAKRLRSILSRRGVKIIVGAAVSKIEQGPEGLVITYAGKKGDEAIHCQTALMAVGRKAVLPEGCVEAGINVNARGFIETDPMMRTSCAGVYAVGDVNGRCMLAHAASAQARVAFGDDVDMEYIPSAVFTSPECAMVGLTEEQCQKEEISYAAAKSMFAANGKALAMGQGEGFVKVLYSPATRLMLGVHVIGPHASDIVAEATVCLTQGATVDDVARSIIHGHPTISEALMAACSAAK
ncbi:MAG: NAD(P)/FAD-dependent oxidoreductase, partial [Clostridium sp.]|nr:NAD(P)/FAD-dependent oxidoreductase [Clostridium sp.]